MDHATSIETLTTSLTVTYSGESNPPPSTSVRQSCSVLSNYLSICLEGGWGGGLGARVRPDADLALRLTQTQQPATCSKYHWHTLRLAYALELGGFVVVLFL